MKFKEGDIFRFVGYTGTVYGVIRRTFRASDGRLGVAFWPLGSQTFGGKAWDNAGVCYPICFMGNSDMYNDSEILSRRR
tara:strand:+ start:462 stop:698 length:237 start_codon:yes stop_codon:yes gene_type:complete